MDSRVQNRCGLDRLTQARGRSVWLILLLTLDVPEGWSEETLTSNASHKDSIELVESARPASDRVRPGFGLGISISPFALPQSELQGDGNQLHLSLEFQPPWIQSVGVFSLGVQGSLISGTTQSQHRSFSSGSQGAVGGLLRYQLRFWSDQSFVPWVGYEASIYRFLWASSVGAVVGGSGWLHGPVVGFGFLLNRLDPSQALSLYHATGVARSYLTFEMSVLNRSSSELRTFEFADAGYFFGLRIER